MLPNEPIDILAIASQRKYHAIQALHYANMMHSSAAAQACHDRAMAEYTMAWADVDAVQTLIRELNRTNK